MYRCGYMSVFLALTYYSSGSAAIILLLLICHFADAALFFSHLTSGLFSSIPYVRPLSSDTLRPVLFFSDLTRGPFFQSPYIRPLLIGPFRPVLFSLAHLQKWSKTHFLTADTHAKV